MKKLAYLILITIIAILSLSIYTNASKNNSQDDKEKTLSEIKYLDSKLVNLLNSINNLETRNYNISVSEEPKQSTQNESSKSSSDSQSKGGESSEKTDSYSSQSSESGTGEETQKKFDLEANGVLNNSQDINWEFIKKEVELIYTSIPTITLDLYKINLNQEDILSFNRDFDDLAVIVKDENKEETLAQLSKLYDYIPKFSENASDDDIYKTIIKTKSDIIKGYSKLDGGNWNGINNNIIDGVNNYSKLLTNTNIDSGKQYGINKGYIMLNELQKSAELKDESVFLIKYKNTLEEINNI